MYLVYPFYYDGDVHELGHRYTNLKRISLMKYPQYDARMLKDNFVRNNNQIFVGTYPA